jgi:integrase/recombinase XerD
MTALRRRLLEDLHLRGLAPRTQQCSLDAVTHLAQHDRRAPAQIRADELRQYLLSLLNDKPVAARTFRLHRYGLRCFSAMPLPRPWPVFTLTRPRHSHTLPVVRSLQEVRLRLTAVVNPQAGMCWQMISAWGLRLRDGTPRQVSDIAPQRMLVRVRQGTGGKDRVVPLAERPLERVRADWKSARPRPWLFPARHEPMPLPPATLQTTWTRVVRQSGLANDASSQTRRPSYATHLLERGLAWRVIHERRGHQRPSTTARDTHLTDNTFDGVQATINALRVDLSTRRRLGMPEMAAVLPRSGRDYLQRFGQDLRPSHRRALQDMLQGRTAALGGQLWPCAHGGQAPYVDHACRTRSGPKCHPHDTAGWLAERRPDLLPVPSCPVVCTRPQARRELVRRHQPDLYDIVLRAAAPALITLAADPHDVGGLIGVRCGLHPWPRTLV